MSTPPGDDTDVVRELMLLMPRMIGRAKRLPPPEQLRSLDLAPRHLSLLAILLLEGALTVNDLAARLGVAPTTVSLLVSDLADKGILVRRPDEADRRRRIVDISDPSRPAISQWLSPGVRAWQAAIAPLSPEQRRLVVDTLAAYERALES